MVLSPTQAYLDTQRAMASSILAKLFPFLFPQVSGAQSVPTTEPAHHDKAARYLLAGQYSRQNERVKAPGLEPARGDHKTSVFMITGLGETDVWALADQHVAPKRGPVLARGDLMVSAIVGVGLKVELADPPPRHANIVGWPLEKHLWKSRAQELAAVATLCMRPGASNLK